MKDGEEEPIEINILGDKQWIYYKDSALFIGLRYYPAYQLGFIAFHDFCIFHF